MIEKNRELRRMARAAGVPLWRIARELGVSEPTLTRWMRDELDGELKERFVQSVKKLGGDEA